MDGTTDGPPGPVRDPPGPPGVVRDPPGPVRDPSGPPGAVRDPPGLVRDPSDLPLDVWMHVSSHLSQADVARLGSCTAGLRAVARRVLEERGVRVTGRSWRAACEHVREARAVWLEGVPRRFVLRTLRAPRLCVPALARLERLRLDHPLLPPDDFWGPTFGGCPCLAHVTVVCELGPANLDRARDLRHLRDLVDLGVPRLTSLDVEARGAFVPPLVRDPLPSGTLRRYRLVCHPLVAPVDARLESLEVDEPRPPGSPCVLAAMGPAVAAGARSVAWTAAPPRLDAALLRPFRALRDVDLRAACVETGAAAAACVASLRHLPAGVRRLRLSLDLGLVRGPCEVAWGRAVAHLPGLRDLDVECTFPPEDVADLLAGWMGAGAGVTRVRARFRQEASLRWREALEELVRWEAPSDDDDDAVRLHRVIGDSEAALDPAPLERFLDARPAAVAHVRGLGHRWQSSHPRCPP